MATTSLSARSTRRPIPSSIPGRSLGPRAILFIGPASSSVENGGIISAVGNAVTPAGNAITFGAGSSNVLTLDPGSSITGRVVGAGADTFQLGGAGTDSFESRPSARPLSIGASRRSTKLGDFDLDADRDQRRSFALDRQRRHIAGGRLDCQFDRDREHRPARSAAAARSATPRSTWRHAGARGAQRALRAAYRAGQPLVHGGLDLHDLGLADECRPHQRHAATRRSAARL